MAATCSLGHLLYFDFLPFISLLTSLYVVAGGLKLRFSLRPSPLANTLFLGLFSILAGFMGTTGAAMLGIHPLLLLNQKRKHKTHTVLFFIFLVCNVGGGFSTLGDPPLFMGFLRGVSFLWPTQYLWAAVLAMVAALLALYAAVEALFFRKEPAPLHTPYDHPRIHIEGKKQLFLLGGIILTMLIAPMLPLTPLLKETLKLGILGAIMAQSFRMTSLAWRRKHKWHWHPLQEVAFIFLALFITAEAPLKLLALGPEGPFSFLFDLLSGPGGSPNPISYFWATGLLSSLLDNAPTYLVFFCVTGLDAQTLMTNATPILKAISLGAVFMGALTYIGNAPNLLVKAIAEEEYHVKMPGFLAYSALAAMTIVPILGILLPFFLG